MQPKTKRTTSSNEAKYGVVAILAITMLFTSLSVAQDARQNTGYRSDALQVEQFDPNDLAERIISGLISERQFRKLMLSDEEVTEVFRHIGLKRDWTITEEALVAIGHNRGRVEPDPSDGFAISTVGACTQDVELQNGSKNFVYPAGLFLPQQGEACGSGPGDRWLPDRVLEYRPRTAPGNANNVKWWSNSWFVRWVLNNPPPVGFGGRLSATGLCTTRIRVCIGARVFPWLGSWDLQTVYLWWN